MSSTPSPAAGSYRSPDRREPQLEAGFPGWTIVSRRFADGWNFCAFQGGGTTEQRMPDIARRTEAELREAIAAFTGERVNGHG